MQLAERYKINICTVQFNICTDVKGTVLELDVENKINALPGAHFFTTSEFVSPKLYYF